jgi:TPR repeat protein
VKSNILVLGLALGATLMTSALAQSTDGVSPGVPDPRILSLHAKVDDLFKDGEVTRAYFIYRNELVPLGDKYAQYMVGYMHLTGLAVQQDRVMASAWYRLAAERGTPEFIQLRDQLLFELNDDERTRSDELYQELRQEYNDLAVLLSSIKRHDEALRARSADRGLGSSAFSPRPRSRESAKYYEQLERELERQLRILAQLGNFADLETDPDEIDIEEIERLVSARIEELSD